MSQTCKICGRGPKKGMQRSHSNVGTIRRQYLNLQRAVVNGKSVRLCTKCIKTMNKTSK